MFAPNFMTCMLPALNLVCNGLICTGFSTCDYEGKILRTYKPQLASLTTQDALKAWRTNTLPESAGITGFIFRKSVLNSLSWDYTGGFFNDTRLALEAISDGGIKIIPDSIIIRRQWGGATSAIDPYSIIKRLKANIDFIQDMAEKGKDYKIPLIRERRLLTNPISLFRNYVFPLLDCDCLPLSFLKEWFRFSKNTPYWVRWQLNIIIPILLMNRGPLQVFQLKLRRVLRGMRRKLLS